ncbi:MAG TPA: tetratricopeptide repeat protein [Verrucomicrobiota bacterium]|nr:tetratricopeptide repeat protein [Verrucomicrobiota bacterium]
MSRFENLEFDRRAEGETASVGLSDEERRLCEADAALRRGDFELALRCYAKLLEINPRNPVAWAGQVRMLIELGDFEQANRWADSAMERFPRDPEVLAAKSVALARRGDWRAALAFSDAALEEGAALPYVWLARGDVLMAGREKRADYCFGKALAVAPKDWLWPWLISRVFFYYRRFSLALRFVSQAVAIDGAQAVVWADMGRCQHALGLAGAAAASFAQAKQLDGSCPEVLIALEEGQEIGLARRLTGLMRRWFRV